MGQGCRVVVLFVLSALAGVGRMAGQSAPVILLPPGNSTVQQEASTPRAVQAETPGEMYKDAMRPLTIVRKSLDNWSDAELGALAVGMRKAKEECNAARPEDFDGDDLYDFTRLCALGQDWEASNKAALLYIARKLEPHRAQAYALSVSALVHMKAMDLATQTTLEMLDRLPYDAEVAYAVRFMKDTLEQASDPMAVVLAMKEHAPLVGALKKNAALKATNGDAVMSVGALYDSAMELAFWQREGGDDAGAAATVADIDAAIKTDALLTAEDAQMVKAVQTRYALLGTELIAPKVERSLNTPPARLHIDRNGAATVLVLFPDWCGGCRKMMKTLTEFAKLNKGTPIHAYGLVFEDDSVIPSAQGHDLLLKELQGTSTFVVPASTVSDLGVVEFPLGVVLDKEGKVRFIGAIPGDAFNGDGYIPRVIERMVGRGKTK